MNAPNPVPTMNHQAHAAGVALPALVQHVVDSLEAHLGAVLEHAKTASPGATQVLARFGEDVLDWLEQVGVGFRGDLEAYRAKVAALGRSTAVNPPQQAQQPASTSDGSSPPPPKS